MVMPPALKKLISQGAQLRPFPQPVLEACFNMAQEVHSEHAKSNPMFLLFPIMMLVSTVGMFAGGGRGRGQAKAEMNEDRKDYLRYLGTMRERARETAREQRAALEWNHPDPAALWSIASSCDLLMPSRLRWTAAVLDDVNRRHAG